MPIHRVRDKPSIPVDSTSPSAAKSTKSKAKSTTRQRRTPVTDCMANKRPVAKLDATPGKPTKRKLNAGGKQLRMPPGPTAAIESKLQELGQSTRPLRAGELADVFIDIRALLDSGTIRRVPQPLLDAVRELAQRSIGELLTQATSFTGPTDFKSIHAEQLGELLLIARGCLENRHQPTAELVAQEGRIRQVMGVVVQERAAQLRALAERAASTAPAESIREAESVAVSLDADNGRLYRYGFDKLPIDSEALVQNVREAAVRYFTHRDHRGRF